MLAMTIPILRVVGVLLVFVGFTGAGWVVRGWQAQGEIAKLENKLTQKDLEQSNEALDQVLLATKTMREQAALSKSDISSVRKELRELRKDFKDAKPLPVDCKPDTVRLRQFESTIETANKAITGHRAGNPVPAPADPAGD